MLIAADTAEMLLEAARAARESAYAPYSCFRVGAALLFKGGEVVAGCNVENSSYGLSVCAERSAMAAAVSRGLILPEAVAVVGKSGVPCPPCGACRQFLSEFNADMYVVMEDGCGFVCRTLSELLPMRFDLISDNGNKR